MPDELRGTAGEAAAVNSEASVVRWNRERRNLSSDARQTREHFIAHEVAKHAQQVGERNLSKAVDIIEFVSIDMMSVRYAEVEISQNDIWRRRSLQCQEEAEVDGGKRKDRIGGLG